MMCAPWLTMALKSCLSLYRLILAFECSATWSAQQHGGYFDVGSSTTCTHACMPF